MGDFWYSALLSFNIVLLIGVGIGVIRNRRALRVIERDQADIERRLREVDAMADKMPLLHGMVGVASWRDLPPDALVQVRRAMREILAEMDGEPPPTRH